jgi:hypothetical protein
MTIRVISFIIPSFALFLFDVLLPDLLLADELLLLLPLADELFLVPDELLPAVLLLEDEFLFFVVDPVAIICYLLLII